jgi:hypothetical protein
MRGYAAMTAPEVLEFARAKTLDVTDIYAPTQSFIAAHTDLDEEEISMRSQWWLQKMRSNLPPLTLRPHVF